MTPIWLNDAVFYEIYPRSFYDSNGDGIGDIPGIIEKLGYIKELGCNALWINPIYESPFKDGGYDITDHKKVAPRYGTNEDAARLFRTAHEMGIKVLLDLVPGHTSDQHPWFLESQKAEANAYTDRYVWTPSAFTGIFDKPYIAGMTERDGAYMLNFFASQPALNYGWLLGREEWMSAPDSARALSTREALKDIMRFWLDMGCDGFRVDMADYLVKNDDKDRSATCAIWRDIRRMLDADYPQAALVSEWSNPAQAINGAGFHMDFYLDHHYNGYNMLLRDYETPGGDHSYFKKDSGGRIERFLDDYVPRYEASRRNGYISMFTCNHDTPRPARTLSEDELKLAYAFILTMPGVPFIYYGDEIGMDYLDVPTKEGGYRRTGSRTPMQWNKGKNRGFSSACAEKLYLPVDSRDDAPNVEDSITKRDSLINTVKELICLRHTYEDLRADADYSTTFIDRDGVAYVYERGNMIMGLNPSSTARSRSIFRKGEIIYTIGSRELGEGKIIFGPQSFCVIKRA